MKTFQGVCRLKLLGLSLIVVCRFSSAQGIPVIDVASLAQAYLQVLAWEQQYNQMIQSLNQQQQFIQNTTGTRSLGQLFNGIQGPVLPANISQTISGSQSHNELNGVAAQNFGLLRQALQTRSTQIQSLMGQINQTTDPKAIAELQARIQAEQVMATNEAKEGELLQLQIDAQHRAIDASNVAQNIQRVN
jgi:type IV secretion system protein VirB5